MEIRRYRPNDQQRVWELHNAALDQAGANLGPGPWDDDFKNLLGVYLDGTGEFLVGVVGGQIVSMGAVRRISDTRARSNDCASTRTTKVEGTVVECLRSSRRP